MLVMVIALGTPEPAFPVVQGLVFAVLAIAWLALRQLWAPQNAAVSVSEVDPSRASHMRMRRLLAGAAVLAIAGGAGVVSSAVAAPVQPRHVFRDVVIPPFNIRDYPSPLQAFRKNVRDEASDTLFTVSGLPKGSRMRIAVMDQFDGMVYNVTDGGPDSSSAFGPIRSNMSPDAEGLPVTLQVEVDEYNGVWVPDAGAVSEIDFTGDRGEELRRSAYYNGETGTAVVTSKLAKGDTYTVDTVIPGDLDDTQLAEVKFGTVPLPTQSNVPEELTALAARDGRGGRVADRAGARSRDVPRRGRLLQPRPRRRGAVARRPHLRAHLDPDRRRSDDRRRRAVRRRDGAAGPGGRHPGSRRHGLLPRRGAEGEAVFTATGDTVHAWVEVNFDGVGWLTFNPTPPEDKVPNDQNTKPRVDPKPQVLQPPPPPQEPVDLPPTLPDDRKGDDESLNILGIIGAILAIGGISLAVLALLASPFILIGAWKAAKRRSRRQAERTADASAAGGMSSPIVRSTTAPGSPRVAPASKRRRPWQRASPCRRSPPSPSERMPRSSAPRSRAPKTWTPSGRRSTRSSAASVKRPDSGSAPRRV